MSKIGDGVFEKITFLHIPYFSPKWPFFGLKAPVLAQKSKIIVLEVS